MKNRIVKTATLLFVALFGVVTSLFAQTSSTSAAAAAAEPAKVGQPAESKLGGQQPSPEEMQKMMTEMMELSKIGDNHKLLADMAGNWNYTVKMMMDPSGKPQESKGTATRKAIMDGRFFLAEHSGKFQMPGPDGKMTDMNFTGMAIEGYDNVKKKFVSSWIDNMGTGIQFSEGTYDPASKTFTFASEMEMMPGLKTPVREVLKVTDKDHMLMEWYETHGGQEKKTMEIAYTRAGKK